MIQKRSQLFSIVKARSGLQETSKSLIVHFHLKAVQKGHNVPQRLGAFHSAAVDLLYHHTGDAFAIRGFDARQQIVNGGLIEGAQRHGTELGHHLVVQELLQRLVKVDLDLGRKAVDFLDIIVDHVVNGAEQGGQKVARNALGQILIKFLNGL